MKAFVGPRVVFKIYGAAGPWAQVDAYLELKADTSAKPWWTLYWGIEASVGVEGEILGYELWSFKLANIKIWDMLLAYAKSDPFCEKDCTGLECGPDPECEESCGTCTGSGETCVEGKCAQCEPDCTGLECGLDPECGASCGTCSGEQTCESGKCVGSVGDTWTDLETGLIWQVTPSTEQQIVGYDSMYCTGLTLDGGGWRVPTVGELRSLIRDCATTVTGGSCDVTDECLSSSTCVGCSGCTVNDGPDDGCYWPSQLEGACGVYWSSSQDTYYHVPWIIDFSKASVSNSYGTSQAYVRCVKTPLVKP